MATDAWASRLVGFTCEKCCINFQKEFNEQPEVYFLEVETPKARYAVVALFRLSKESKYLAAMSANHGVELLDSVFTDLFTEVLDWARDELLMGKG